ncbi:ATP phosphoribosyltransferase regulatory subunit [Filobacillus milosensis]|uniref:ATP phosphoribosyltransferase regulatory subunit n=1 Tax=Filobacillus milosensis TaxID=94137 RepID=A0A4Y8IMY2_9BACI|nr:ATP phosphoribosyltransferase regulatory subunit [Filobacillus milosensis]TFB21715.1 ATP phosphoribosyltransferase regulatory subunit [Filobacillus milosensis]
MQFGKQLPQGVADLYSNDYENKEYIIKQINQLTKLYGFKPIQTPTFEYYDLFMNMPGTLDPDQMIKLIDHDGKILVLRPDATVPIARMVANSNQPLEVEKLSYVTNIFRMQNGESDVFSRSFTQLGVECFGKKNRYVDVEMIALAIETLKTVGLQRYQIDLGQAKFFQALMDEINPTPELQREIQEKLEQKNEFELEQILNENHVNEKAKQVLTQLTYLFGNPREVIKKAKPLALNSDMLQAINELEWIVEQINGLGLSEYISIDLGLVNNLNYYTGVMFQGFVHDFGRSVIQGGRYDSLTEQFGIKVDAIGFGVYLDQLIDVLDQQDISLKNDTAMINVKSQNSIYAFQVANELRRNGYAVNLFDQKASILIDLDEKLISNHKGNRTFDGSDDLLKKVGQFYGEN